MAWCWCRSKEEKDELGDVGDVLSSCGNDTLSHKADNKSSSAIPDPTSKTRTGIVAEKATLAAVRLPQSAAGQDKIFGADVDSSEIILSAVVGAIAWLDANWLHAEGLWRRPGNGAQVKAKVPEVDATGAFPMDDDCHTLVSLLVKFMALVPGKLLSAAAATQLLAALEDPNAKFEVILSDTTTPAKCTVFGALVAHWARVVADPQNKMDTKAMAICVFCVLFDGPMNLKLVQVVQRFIDDPSCCVRSEILRAGEKVKVLTKQRNKATKILQYSMGKVFDATLGLMIKSWLTNSLDSQYIRIKSKYPGAMECGRKYGWSLRKCVEAGERIEAGLREHNSWTNTGSEASAALQMVMEFVMAEVEQTQVRGVGQKMTKLNAEYSRLSSRFIKAMEVAKQHNWPLPKCVAIGLEIERRVEGVKISSQPAAALYYMTEFVEAEQLQGRMRKSAVKIQAIFRGKMSRKQRLNLHGTTAAHIRRQRHNRQIQKRLDEFAEFQKSASFCEGVTCTDILEEVPCLRVTQSEQLNCESDAVKCMRVAGVQKDMLQVLQDSIDGRSKDEATDPGSLLDYAMRRASSCNVESSPKLEAAKLDPKGKARGGPAARGGPPAKGGGKGAPAAPGGPPARGGPPAGGKGKLDPELLFLEKWKKINTSEYNKCDDSNSASNTGQKDTHLQIYKIEPAKEFGCPPKYEATAAETQSWNQVQEQAQHRISISPKNNKYSAPSA